MHPNASFRWTDQDAMRDFVQAVSFGALFAGTPDGPRVAHVPAVWLGETTLGLHVARGNGITRWLDGTTALFVVHGPDAYVSPDWYDQGPDEVPTWNYVAVELEGTCHRLDRDATVVQIEQLGAEQEARLPKEPWRLDKVDPKRVETLLKGLVGFRLEITAWRGTRKLAQTKPDAARLAAADRLAEHGRPAIAHWMRHA
jgi:transcriptional regulator